MMMMQCEGADANAVLSVDADNDADDGAQKAVSRADEADSKGVGGGTTTTPTFALGKRRRRRRRRRCCHFFSSGVGDGGAR